jgi:hypothetical protein
MANALATKLKNRTIKDDDNSIDELLINYYEKVDLLFINKTTNYCCNHVSDLALAAELGKSLLERNQDLQTNILTLEQIIVEKNREIQVNSSQIFQLIKLIV